MLRVFPGGSDGKESASNAGDLGLIPGIGRSPGEGQGYPLQQGRVPSLPIPGRENDPGLCTAAPGLLLAAHQAPPSLGFSRQEHWSAKKY